MSYEFYLCYGGQEIINGGRTAAMIAAGKGPQGITCQTCAPCPEMDKGLGYDGAYNPADNPWFDPNEPDSADFAGLLVTSITGLEPGAITRTVTQNVTSGAVLGTPVQAAPQVVVTALLMAATCCGQEYGLRWLRSALQGACGAGCGGSDLVFLDCQPQFSDEDCGPVDFEAELAPYFRTMKNAALISGPTTTEIPRGCPDCYDCGFLQVTFTFAAGDPCVYRNPVQIVTDDSFDLVTDCSVTWVNNMDGTANCASDDTCVTAANCATDPNCVDVAPPSMPTLADSCVKSCIALAEYQSCFDIPANTFPSTTDGTLIIEIYSGDLPMRNIEVRVWQNPMDLAPSDLPDCDVCSSLAISYIAPNSTLTIDGTTKSATISCPGGTSVRANPYIATTTGSSNFAYPNFAGCGEQYTVCITAAAPVSELATLNVVAVAKEC